METNDIFTDQVQVSRPVLIEQLSAVSFRIIADTGDVVGQRIQPYIYYMSVIKIYRNTPLERSTGYAKICFGNGKSNDIKKIGQ